MFILGKNEINVCVITGKGIGTFKATLKFLKDHDTQIFSNKLSIHWISKFHEISMFGRVQSREYYSHKKLKKLKDWCPLGMKSTISDCSDFLSYKINKIIKRTKR